MATGTDIDADVADGGPRLERIPTGAMDCGFPIDWMNTLLHDPITPYRTFTPFRSPQQDRVL